MLMPGMLTKKQMDALKKANGAEFDRLFLSGMIQHHNGALVMVKDLKIKNRVLSVHYDLFHDYPTYKFRFQKGDFYLIGANISGIHGGNYSEDDINLSTGEVHKTSYDVDDEKNVKKKIFRLKNLKPIKFAAFKMPLTYKISEDYTL
jgi:hypothetical protein